MFTLTTQKLKTVYSRNPVIDTFQINGINGNYNQIINCTGSP